MLFGKGVQKEGGAGGVGPGTESCPGPGGELLTEASILPAAWQV